MPAPLTSLRAILTLHEGKVNKLYRCSAGKLTIGIGHNLEAGRAGDKAVRELAEREGRISDELVYTLFEQDVKDVIVDLSARIPWFLALNEVRQAVLIDMGFNLGVPGLMKFQRTLASCRAGEYERCAKEMLQSKWASQVGSRAVRLSKMMRTGEWPG